MWNKTVITGVSVIKRLSLYGFSLWGRDLASVVRIIEVIFTNNVWAFSRDQVNCPYYRGVRKERFDCMRCNISLGNVR